MKVLPPFSGSKSNPSEQASSSAIMEAVHSSERSVTVYQTKLFNYFVMENVTFHRRVASQLVYNYLPVVIGFTICRSLYPFCYIRFYGQALKEISCDKFSSYQIGGFTPLIFQNSVLRVLTTCSFVSG
jgi:hypothetical protein